VQLSDEQFISAPHQRIKEAIEGIGSNFNTIDDLEAQLLDRLSPDREAMAAFVEVLLKVDVLRKQNLPIEKIILEFRVVLLKERITRALSTLRSSLTASDMDVDMRTVQSKIIELNSYREALNNPELSLEEIASLRRKMGDIVDAERP
jgi:hypothetical protein